MRYWPVFVAPGSTVARSHVRMGCLDLPSMVCHPLGVAAGDAKDAAWP